MSSHEQTQRQEEHLHSFPDNQVLALSQDALERAAKADVARALPFPCAMSAAESLGSSPGLPTSRATREETVWNRGDAKGFAEQFDIDGSFSTFFYGSDDFAKRGEPRIAGSQKCRSLSVLRTIRPRNSRGKRRCPCEGDHCGSGGYGHESR